MEAVTNNEFEKAKWIVTEKNEILLENWVVNFYSNEYSLIIQPFFHEFFTRQVLSCCTSPFCPEPEDNAAVSVIPTFNNLLNKKLITELDFNGTINTWFNPEDSTQCKRKFVGQAPDKQYIFWEANAQTKVRKVLVYHKNNLYFNFSVCF